MPRMTGGEAIVDGLLRHGIDTVFGLPGVQTYGLFDAFARASNRLRLINARHEQTTAYMALGYACATGRPVGLRRGARSRRAQHHRRAGHRLGRQRAGAVPDRPGAQHDDRPRPRPVARTAGPARHAAQPAEMGRADRASEPGLLPHRARLPGDAVRPPRAGRAGDAVGPVRRHRPRSRRRTRCRGIPTRRPIPTGSPRWRSCWTRRRRR